MIATMNMNFESRQQDNSGMTALMYVCDLQNLDWKSNTDIQQIVKLLVVECRKQDTSGETALMHAIRNKNIVAIKILAHEEAHITDNEGNTALMRYLQYFNGKDELGKRAAK